MSKGEKYINLGNKELVNIKKLSGKCEKEVLIFDCCRTAFQYNYITSKYRITEANLKTDVILVRKKYEELIEACTSTFVGRISSQGC